MRKYLNTGIPQKIIMCITYTHTHMYIYGETQRWMYVDRSIDRIDK